MLTSPTAELWEVMAVEAARQSPLWAAALRPDDEQEREPVFSPLCQERYALGLETIYEGYLLHYGRPRLFAPADADTALLLGDYLYAHGLVRIARFEAVDAVADLAALISLCSQIRAEGRGDDGVPWVATSARLGVGDLEEARIALRHDRDPAPLLTLARATAGSEAVERALGGHRRRVS